MDSAEFQAWGNRMREGWRYHRKLWEYAFITQALYERGVLVNGSHGIGFAVGQEPLPSFFASLGCNITATDLGRSAASLGGWVSSGQHANNCAALNRRGLCPEADFTRLVTFREVNMNCIPNDLVQFDFAWSACAFEHLGSLKHGADFIVKHLDCLRKDGIAVHTTEYNVSSNTQTIENARISLFRKCDLIELIHRLRQAGHGVEEFDDSTGVLPADLFVDRPPYPCQPSHLKLDIEGFTCTSAGIIITKK